MHHIEEEWNVPKCGEPARDNAVRPLELAEQEESGPERHHQKEQRWRIFFAVDEGQERAEPCALSGPPYRIAIEVEGPQHDEAPNESCACPGEKGPAYLWGLFEQRGKDVAHRHNARPGYQWIQDQQSQVSVGNLD